jgi:hypothetical protein
MQRLGTTLDTIPAEVPYVTVDPQRAAALAPLLSVGGLKVGLVWDGNPRQSAARNRSVPLAALRPLLAVAGAKFFSLQVGPRAKDIAEAGLADQIIDLSHYFDFADSAAALSRLDLLSPWIPPSPIWRARSPGRLGCCCRSVRIGAGC